MKKKLPFLIPAVFSGLLIPTQGEITIHGSTTAYQETGGDWLTMGANDIDSNGSLGTDGYIFFGVFDGVNTSGGSAHNYEDGTVSSSFPSYVTANSAGANFTSIADEFDGYGEIDNPDLLDGTNTLGGAAVATNGNAGTNNEIINFTISGLTVDQTVRIGVLAGLINGDGRWDSTSITLSDGISSATVGDHDTNPLEINPGGVESGWVFFDVDADGDYTISATKRVNNQGSSIAGLTFDSVDGSNPDMDNDGLIDAWEMLHFGDLDEVAIGDPDLDDLANSREFNETTDPNLADTDGDGANDGLEVDGTPSTDPRDRDTDDDGLEDGEENTLGTNPTLTDTDGDNFEDALEVEFGSDPTDLNSLPDVQVGYAEVGGDWLTMGTNDIDSNGRLGSDGYIFYGNFDGMRATNQAFEAHQAFLPPYVVNHSPGADFASIASGVAGYGMIDDPTLLDGTDAIGGVATATNTGIGTTSEVITFEISGLSPEQIVRVGILGGVEGNQDGRWDPTRLFLSGAGTIGTAVDLAINPGGANTGWLFFDLSADGVYSIAGTQRLANQGIHIGGITFDSIGGVSNDPDNDGLSSADEINLYETDPNNPDTDGDGQSDGDEVLFADTDPLDAQSVLQVTAIDLAEGNISLTWASVPGRNYTVQTSLDLQTWTDLGSILAAESPETTTSLNVGPLVAGEPKRFYRVEANSAQ